MITFKQFLEASENPDDVFFIHTLIASKREDAVSYEKYLIFGININSLNSSTLLYDVYDDAEENFDKLARMKPEMLLVLISPKGEVLKSHNADPYLARKPLREGSEKILPLTTLIELTTRINIFVAYAKTSKKFLVLGIDTSTLIINDMEFPNIEDARKFYHAMKDSQSIIILISPKGIIIDSHNYAPYSTTKPLREASERRALVPDIVGIIRGMQLTAKNSNIYVVGEIYPDNARSYKSLFNIYENAKELYDAVILETPNIIFVLISPKRRDIRKPQYRSLY